MESLQTPPRRILLVRNDRIGDLVLTLPAIEAVRRHWPHAQLSALVNPYTAPLLSNSRVLNNVVLDDTAESPWQLGRRLRAMRFDAAVVFNTNTRNCLAVWHAGIGQRVCWAYKPAGWILGNRRVALHRSHPPVHEAEFALAFVRRLGIKADLARLAPKLQIDPAIRQRVAERIREQLGTSGPLFGVHPGNKNSAYNWPQGHYATLVRRLARYGRVMVTGSAAEEPLLAAIRSQLDDNLRSRVAFFTDFELLELAAALSMQTALTVSSTGPMHIAGLLATPIVGLFSPHPVHAPAKWAPLGSGHTLLVPPLEPGEPAEISVEQAPAVMERIGVERVLEANLHYAKQALISSADTTATRVHTRSDQAA